MPLASEPDDGNFMLIQQPKINITIIVDCSHSSVISSHSLINGNAYDKILPEHSGRAPLLLTLIGPWHKQAR